MFVAVEPSPEARDHLDSFLDVRRAAGAFRWTDPEHLHLTLAFLGEVADHRLDDLVDRLGAAAGRRRPFAAAVAGGGAFPDVAEGRVLYADLALEEAASTELERLATGARHAAVASGLRVDGRRFRPHLTVARLGQAVDLTRWVRLLDAYRGPTWSVGEVTLVASYLGQGRRGRPRHETIAALELG